MKIEDDKKNMKEMCPASNNKLLLALAILSWKSPFVVSPF